VDIVKEMLAIASGRRLRWAQEDIRHKGWAIECRITAEDPINNFMPSGGVVTTLQEPTGPGVRVESGIYEGFEVSLYYDPMIAKLIVWGENRAEALLRMRRALNEYRIGGLTTSIPFHQQMMNSTQFMWGAFDTNFLEDRFAVTYIERPEMELSAAIAAALVAHSREQAATVMHQTAPASGSAWKRGLSWKRAG
jgi:acetyl/propionyl-CoA carboxylase alpha subunit